LRFKSFEREDRFDAMTDAIQTFLAMGGYAKFVWPAYALAAIVLVGLLVISLRQLRKTEAELAALGLARPRERA
jgi:heme exporter protein D